MRNKSYRPRLILFFILFFLLFSAKAFAQLPENESFPNGEPQVKWSQSSDGKGIIRKEYFITGDLKSEGMYLNSQLNGEYKEYFQNGKNYLNINFKDGKEDGLYKEYAESGDLVKEVNFKDGSMDGVYKEYQDGKIYKELNFKDGLREGEMKVYFPNGVVQIKTNFHDDHMEGAYEEYDETGHLKTKDTMKDDEIVGHEGYDNNGGLEENNSSSAGIIEDKTSSANTSSRGSSLSEKVKTVAQAIPTKEIKTKLSELKEIYASKIKENKSLGLYPFIFLIVFVLIGAFFALNSLYTPEGRKEPIKLGKKLTALTTDTNKEFNFLNDESKALMYRRLVESVSSGLFVSDLNGSLIFANYALMDILGITAKTDIFGFNINDRFLGMNAERRVLLGEIEDHGGGQFKYNISKEDEIILSVSASYMMDDKGNKRGIQGVIQDITERGRLEESLFVEKNKMDLMLKIFEQVDTIKDVDELSEYIVKSIAGLFVADRCSLMLLQKDNVTLKVMAGCGFKDEKVIGSEFKLGETISGVVAQQGQAVLVKNIEYDKQFQTMRKKGPNYLGRSFMIAPLEFNDQVFGVINVSEKKAEIKNAQPFDEVDLRVLQHVATKLATALKNVEIFEELNLLTHTDPLTQIYNYRLLSESLDREIKRFKRDKNPLCVFMMDLDGFKSYNDSFGHLEGDELLKGLGGILKNSLRETDIACRYAGDEFCAILPNTTLDGVKNAAEKVIKAVANHQFKKQVTISIGAAMYEESMIKKDFLAKADKALYQAKHSGKNQVVIFP